MQKKAMDKTRAEEHNWVYIGQGEWYDPFFVFPATGEQVSFDVYLEECTEHPGEIRVRDTKSWLDFFNEDCYPIIYCPKSTKVYVGYYEVKMSDDTTQPFIQLCPEWGFVNVKEYGKIEGNIITIPNSSIGQYVSDSDAWGYLEEFTKNLKIILPSNWQYVEPPATTSGIYFGITAFNYLPEIIPMELLTVNNKNDYKDFVNSREKDSYTYLYYSVEQALDALNRKRYPEDLKNVALITFTDGNDDGSLSMAPDKSWDDEDYQNYIETLIAEASVQGIKLDAYSIGLKGDDIGDYNYEMFKSNLEAFATDPKDKNATEVKNMKEVENTLNEILDGLENSWLNKTVRCKINMRATGDKIRFTLDKTREEMNYNPENSDLWIEGIFSRDDNSINDVVYHGFTSTSGSKVVAQEVQINGKTKYQFTFENLMDSVGDLLQTGEIHFWHATKSNPSVWQPHKEFIDENGAEIETERSSAAIMFVMDCSTSLGDDFEELKRVVIGLIDRLAPDSEVSSSDELKADYDALPEYYTLQGIKVANPSSGIFIVKKGDSVRKVMFGQ